MSEEKKSALAPRLRFPGFGDTWATTSMSNLYSFKGNNSLSRDKLNYEAGELRNIHYGDIHTKFALHFRVDAESVPYINAGESSSAIRPENYCMAGDMVFADASEDMADIGKAIEIIDAGDVPLVSGLHTILARPNEGSFSLGFGAYLFSSEGVRKQIQREGQGAKVLGLSATRLGNVKLHYPSKPDEQQKIADCLSSLDELITAETQKLDALKTHKKGLMQQLFPREGEAVPRLRFPEFRKAGKWEETAIGEKLDLLSGFPFDGTEIREDASGVPLMRGINITEGFIRHNQDIDRFFCGSSAELEKYRLRENDLVIGMDGSKVGKNSALVTNADAGALLIQRVARLRSKCETTIRFVFQHINSNFFHAYVDRINTSGGIPHISLKQISDFKICFPWISEQQQIADCLSSLDELIAAETQKLEALRTHKQGLMQQLFPVLDEAQA